MDLSPSFSPFLTSLSAVSNDTLKIPRDQGWFCQQHKKGGDERADCFLMTSLVSWRLLLYVWIITKLLSLQHLSFLSASYVTVSGKGDISQQAKKNKKPQFIFSNHNDLM